MKNDYPTLRRDFIKLNREHEALKAKLNQAQAHAMGALEEYENGEGTVEDLTEALHHLLSVSG